MPTCPKATTSAPENPAESGNLDCIDEDDNGSDYAGKVTVTVTGATCNKWSDADLGNWAYGSMGEYKKLPENFCRNPDNSKLPWCFVAGTKDSYYQGAEGRAFCDVPACPADPSAPTCREFLFFFHFSFHLFSTFRKWGKGQGGDYKGTISVTRNGATCEKWSKADLGNWGGGEMGKWRWGTTILIIMVIIIIMNIISTMTIMTIRWSHNHCRNPNNQDRGPWCYVPGKKDSYYIGRQGWEYCSVPYCEGKEDLDRFPA